MGLLVAPGTRVDLGVEALGPVPCHDLGHHQIGRIVDAIERGRPEVFPAASGRWLAFLRGVLPGLVDRIMERLAVRLGESEVNGHAKAEASDHRPVPESR